MKQYEYGQRFLLASQQSRLINRQFPEVIGGTFSDQPCGPWQMWRQFFFYFQMEFSDRYPEHFEWNSPQVNSPEPYL